VQVLQPGVLDGRNHVGGHVGARQRRRASGRQERGEDRQRGY
jgi:hypothetical protein